MMANAITGVEIARTQIRVRKVMLACSVLSQPVRALIGPLSWLEPLYGIDGTAVDAKLEIQFWRPRRRGADSADFRASVHVVAALHPGRSQVAVQRIAI